jgi:hypothetical protein
MALEFVVFCVFVAAAAVMLNALVGLCFRSTGVGNWVDQYWGDGSIPDDWALRWRQVESTTPIVVMGPTPPLPKRIVAEIRMKSNAVPLEYGAVVDHVRFMSDYNLEIVAEPAFQRATVRAPIGYAVDIQMLHLSLLAVAGDAGVERVGSSSVQK